LEPLAVLQVLGLMYRLLEAVLVLLGQQMQSDPQEAPGVLVHLAI